MADYYTRIAQRAFLFTGSAGKKMRRAVYEMARSNLISQLGAVKPGRSKAYITDERLALEAAIRKVEAEAARVPRRARTFILSELLARPAQLPLLTRIFWESTRLPERRRHNKETAKPLKDDFYLRLVRQTLADVASPAPFLTRDGQLDAGPNSPYDVPATDDDLSMLPVRQRSIIRTIRSGLPGNAPKQLGEALENYDDELAVRGAQPILGLLKDMAAIIQADVGDASAVREWLEPGMQEAFRRFAENHDLFVQHFPLDTEREEFYEGLDIDETGASGRALSDPFEAVAKAGFAANKAGLTTDDFIRIIDKLAEFAKVISTLPPTSSAVALGQNNKNVPSVSAKRRALLSGFGFFERTYNLAGSTATLAATEQGQAFFAVLHQTLAALSKLIGI